MNFRVVQLSETTPTIEAKKLAMKIVGFKPFTELSVNHNSDKANVKGLVNNKTPKQLERTSSSRGL